MALKVSQPMLSAASDAATAAVCSLRYVPVTHTTHTVVWGADVTAGAVTIEAAETEDYSGTWSSLATVTFGTVTTTETVSIEGPYKFIRHRVSTAVAGGTVSTYLRAV